MIMSEEIAGVTDLFELKLKNKYSVLGLRQKPPSWLTQKAHWEGGVGKKAPPRQPVRPSKNMYSILNPDLGQS